MAKIFCVEFQRYSLKFHTKYLTHTLKDMILYNIEILRALRFKSSYAFLKRPPRHIRHWMSSYGICSAFSWDNHSLDVDSCLAMKFFEDDQQCFEFNLVFE